MSASCEVTVGNPPEEPEEEPLPDQFEIEEEKHVLLGVKAGTSPEELREELEQQGDVEITDQNGDSLREGAKVGTGCIVKLPGREEYLTVMIPCDVNGDGDINVMDIITTRDAFLKIDPLDGVYLQAAKGGEAGDGDLTVMHILLVREAFLKEA